MGYSAKAVANYFLDAYGDMKKSPKICPLKLQKLVYIAHGWSLALLDKPLVNDEYAESWPYGPVFPSLYHEFKDFGKDPVNRNAMELRFDNNDNDFKCVTEKVKTTDKESRTLLDRIWDVYGGYSPIQLSNMTHKEGSPWSKARAEAKGMRNFHIDNEIIKNYYKDMANAHG